MTSQKAVTTVRASNITSSHYYYYYHHLLLLLLLLLLLFILLLACLLACLIFSKYPITSSSSTQCLALIRLTQPAHNDIHISTVVCTNTKTLLLVITIPFFICTIIIISLNLYTHSALLAETVAQLAERSLLAFDDTRTAPYTHYRVNIKTSSGLYLSQMNPIHFLTHYFSKTTNVLPSTCKSRGISLRASFAHFHARDIFCPSSLICSNGHLFLYMHKHTVWSKLRASECHRGRNSLPLGFKQMK